MDQALRLVRMGCVIQVSGVRGINRVKDSAPGTMDARIQVDSIKISCQEKELI